MTKEEMIEQVEMADKIYAILKSVHVTKRSNVWNLVDQFNQADWQVHHAKEREEYRLKAMANDPITQSLRKLRPDTNPLNRHSEECPSVPEVTGSLNEVIL